MFFIISDGGLLSVLCVLIILVVVACCMIVAEVPVLLATIIIPHINILLGIGIPLTLFLCFGCARIQCGKHYGAIAVETLSFFLVAQSFFVFVLFGLFPGITDASTFDILFTFIFFFMEFGFTGSIALYCNASLLDDVDEYSIFSRCIRCILSLSISMIHVWLWMWVLKITNTTVVSIMEAYQVEPNHIMTIIARLIESVPNFFGIES